VTGPVSGGYERGTGAPSRSTGMRGTAGAILIVLALGLALRVILAYLLPGSGFETDLSGWSSNGVTRVTTNPHSGVGAAQVANSSGSCTLNDSPNWVGSTSAGAYTGSLWVRAATAGTVVKLRFREYQGGSLVSSSTTTTTVGTSWQQLQVAYTVATAGTTLDLNAYVSSPPAGTCFFADDAVINGP